MLCVCLAAANAAVGKDQTSDHFELQDLLPLSFQKNPRVQLSVITEYTADGKNVTPATPQKPVYYVSNDSDVVRNCGLDFSHDTGLTSTGDVVAGEKPPPIKKLSAALKKALAANGYLPADQTHPPSLIIVYRWGSFNHLETSLNLSTDVPSEEKMGAMMHVDMDNITPMDELQQQNLVARAAIVGGTQFSLEVKRALLDGHLKEFRLRDIETSQLMDQASQDLYFVIASAYDFSSVQNGQKTLLWRTKISAPSEGMEMDSTLPQIVTNAAPYFGREMAKAKPLHVRIYKGKVQMAEPKVEGYMPTPGK